MIEKREIHSGSMGSHSGFIRSGVVVMGPESLPRGRACRERGAGQKDWPHLKIGADIDDTI